MLGVNARLGRVIVPDDDKPTAAPVALISSKYWHSRFGTDPSVVGKTIKINNVARHDRRRPAAGLHRRAAADRRAAGHRRAAGASAAARHRAAAAARQRPAAVAPGPADLLVAAGHGPAEARRHRRAGARQPGDRLPADRARRARCLHEVADRRRARDLVQPEPHRGAAPARRIRRARDLRREHERPPVGHASSWSSWRWCC